MRTRAYFRLYTSHVNFVPGSISKSPGHVRRLSRHQLRDHGNLNSRRRLSPSPLVLLENISGKIHSILLEVRKCIEKFAIAEAFAMIWRLLRLQ